MKIELLQHSLDISKMTYEEWLMIRKRGIGGSDYPIIKGCSKFKSPLELYHDKLSQDIVVDETGGMKAMVGKKMEKTISEIYEMLTGNLFINTSELLVHDKHKFIIGNPDGYVNVPGLGYGVAEIKNTERSVYNTWKEEGLPKMYYFQGQHYLVLTGLSYIQFLIFINGYDLQIITVEANKEIQQMIIEDEWDFWYNHVEKEIPPPPLAKEDFIKGDGVNDIEIETVDANYQIVQEIKDIKKQISELDKLKKAKELQIKRVMEYAGKLTYHGEVIATFKENGKNDFDTKRLRNEMPEIYKEFSNKVQERRFYTK